MIADVSKFIFTSWKELKHNTIIVWSHRAVLFIYTVSFVIILWRLPHLPPLVPLWYSRPWGTDQLAHPYWLLLLPSGGLIWYGINIIVSTYLHRAYLTFVQLLYLTSLLVSILSFITLIKIITIVG